MFPDVVLWLAIGVALGFFAAVLFVYWPEDHRPAGTVTVIHGDLNCSDFLYSFPTPPGDPNHLDGDHDGQACEANPPSPPGVTAPVLRP